MAKNLCIIPARGGSKRIPRKNIKIFLGKPIIAYSIEAAISSGIFEEIMVSTEDKEIADIAIKYGAKVPFYRSAEAADDFATTRDVLLEVVNEYENRGNYYDHISCIYPCAPFISAEKLRMAYRRLKEKNIHHIFTVIPFEFPIQRAIKIINNQPRYYFPEYDKYRSQDTQEAFHDAGQFYFYTNSSLKEGIGVIFDKCEVYKISPMEAQDIDVESDWEIAELKYERIKSKNNL